MVLKDSRVSCAGQDEQIDVKVIEDAYLKGIVYAHRKLARFSQSGLSASISAEDVVHTAMLKILDGTRHWNQEKVPDLFVHLAGCIKGEISNRYRSAENLLIDRGVSAEELDAVETEQPKTPEEIAELKQIVQAILAYIKRKRCDLLDVAQLMYEDEIEKPREIAATLRISVKEVNTKKFALKRMFKDERGDRFLIRYIADNHSHLEQMAIAILENKLERAKELSDYLRIPEMEARSQRDEVFSILDSVRKGLV